tara:strand:+ start:4011 stop:4280 length:270 start_codon:yes stop_codon:yes gene_type:complete
VNDLPSIRRSLQILVLVALFVTAYFARDLILPIMHGFLLALTLIIAGLSLLIGLYLTALGLPKGICLGHPRRACGGAVFCGVQSDLREL